MRLTGKGWEEDEKDARSDLCRTIRRLDSSEVGSFTLRPVHQQPLQYRADCLQT